MSDEPSPPSRPPSPPAADDLLASVRPPKGLSGVAVVDASGESEICSTGSHPDGEWYELGSVTKTLTATLLARLVVDGVVTLDHTVGSLLGEAAGRASAITLRQLATHTSGLPKLPPGAMRPPFWPRDPYRFFGPRRQRRALALVELGPPGQLRYSNFGYSLLGVCLATATSMPIGALLAEQVFAPVGMSTARCQPCSARGLVRSHGHWLMAGRRWHNRLPGAGGVDGTIADMAAWARANLIPDATPLGPAIRLAQQVHHRDDKGSLGLGWIVTAELRWHDGATGGFQSAIAIGERHAAAGVAAYGPVPGYDLSRPIRDAVRTT